MPFLSIVIPAYNEEERLPETLALVRDYVERQKFEIEVLVVNDGSTDRTAERVEEIMSRFPQLKLINNTENRGKGAVVQQGMQAATGEYRLFMDADYSTPVTELDKFLPLIKQADVIIGSRYLEADSIKVKQPWKRRIVSRTGNWLIQRTLLPGIVDTQCGFKLFSAAAVNEVFPHQTMMRWSFDVELLTIAKERGLTILEIPVDWYDAKQSKLRAIHAATRSFQDLKTIRKRVKKRHYQRKSKEAKK
jgi:dolichyl-phosphate beta-glucosyltransferase